jgi:hypothetical protein
VALEGEGEVNGDVITLLERQSAALRRKSRILIIKKCKANSVVLE